MPIRFASEAWPRPGLAEPRSASIAGCGNTGPLSATEQKGKECHNQDKQAQGASFGGSFLVPEIDMIFGDGVGASLVEEQQWYLVRPQSHNVDPTCRQSALVCPRSIAE